MSSFLDLVVFEFKKIFKRKTTYIALFLTLVMIILTGVTNVIGYTYIQGERANTKYEEMVIDRTYERELSGRLMDQDLILEVRDAYQKLSEQGEGVFIEAYQEYVRPYRGVSRLLESVYLTEGQKIDMTALKDIDEIDSLNFYSQRTKKVESKLNLLPVTDAEKEKHMELNAAINIPFTFDYVGGYYRFMAFLYSNGIFMFFGIAICLAPIFAGEYSSKADQIILSTRFGKSKVINAKLFAGIGFTAMVATLFSLISLIECLWIYGFDGANAPVQFIYEMSTYPMTVFQASLLMAICVIMASILLSSITLMLSSFLKSPFGVIILMSVIIFVPMFINVSDSNRLLYTLVMLMPGNMITMWGFFSDYMFNIFGHLVLTYQFNILFCIVITLAMLALARPGFKYHQIG